MASRVHSDVSKQTCVWLPLVLVGASVGCKSKTAPTPTAGSGSAQSLATVTAFSPSTAGSAVVAGSASAPDPLAHPVARAVFGGDKNPLVLGPGGLVHYSMVVSEADNGKEEFFVKRLCGDAAVELLTKAWIKLRADASNPGLALRIECSEKADLTSCGQSAIADIGYRIDMKNTDDQWTAVGVRTHVSGLGAPTVEAIRDKLTAQYDTELASKTGCE